MRWVHFLTQIFLADDKGRAVQALLMFRMREQIWAREYFIACRVIQASRHLGKRDGEISAVDAELLLSLFAKQVAFVQLATTLESLLIS